MKPVGHLVIFTLFFICPIAVFGQEATREEFRQYQQKVDTRINQLRDSIKIQNLTLETSKIYYEKAVEHLTIKDKINSGYLALVTTFAAFLGFVVGFFGINYYNAQARIKKYKEETQKELFEKLSLWIGANKETVKYLVEEQEAKEALKNNTRILVLSHSSDEEERPYKDLLSHGFKQVKPPVKLDDNFDIESLHDFGELDLVILDNQHKIKDGNWNFSEPEEKVKLQKLLSKINVAELKFVYYGENNKWDGRIKSLKEWNEGEDKGIATTIMSLRKALMDLIYPFI